MITFDRKGLLTPNRAISCTLGELKTHFVDNFSSKTRQDIYCNFVEYSNQLKALLGVRELKQWVNGSFVTLTPNPRDIDFVTFIESKSVAVHKENLKNFISNNSWLNLGLDPYIIEVPEHANESFFRYESDKAYWTHKFETTRRDRAGRKNPKGFLEIIH